MPEIRPLRPYRYADTEALPSLVAPPYDVIGPELRETLGERSPNNVVHIDLPEGDGDEKYARAAGLLNQWIDKGVLVRDDEPYFLTYEQTFEPPGGGEPITRRGFFALVRAEPYETRQVLPHERTLSGPKVDRHKLFVATGAALSPVFLLFQDPDGATQGPIRGSAELASFTTDDGIQHRLGRVTDPAQVAAMVRSIEKQPLLIADGHHRYETTVGYGAEMDEAREAEGAEPAPNGAHRYVLAFLAEGDAIPGSSSTGPIDWSSASRASSGIRSARTPRPSSPSRTTKGTTPVCRRRWPPTARRARASPLAFPMERPGSCACARMRSSAHP